MPPGREYAAGASERIDVERIVAALERELVGERLERRAGLAKRLHAVVAAENLVRKIIRRADVGENVAGTVVDDQRGAVGDVISLQRRNDVLRSAPARNAEALVDRSCVLYPRHRLRAVRARKKSACAASAIPDSWRRTCSVSLKGEPGCWRLDFAEHGHALQDKALPRAQGAPIAVGRETSRVVWNRRKQRRLRKIEIGGGFAEIRSRRRLDAVDVSAHRHAIDVRFEDRAFDRDDRDPFRLPNLQNLPADAPLRLCRR